MKSEQKKIVIAIIVFIITFLVFREIFSNWDVFKTGLME